MGDDKSLDLVARSLAATVAGTVGLMGPEYGAAATALTPIAEEVLRRVWDAFDVFDWRRRRHITETMVTAAQAREETVDELLKRALEDDESQELFVRVGVAARDAALREKRVALGRALAAGLGAGESAVNDELLFVRAIDALDKPHIQLLHVMTGTRPGTGPMAGQALTDGWTRENLTPFVPTLSRHLPSLLATLEQHGLIESQIVDTWNELGATYYNVTSAGRVCLGRLTLDAQQAPEVDEPEPVHGTEAAG